MMIFAKMEKSCKWICALFLIFFQSTVFSEELESLDNLKTITKNFITNSITLAEDETMDVQFIQNNMSLKLSRCSEPVTARLPEGMTKEHISAVQLTCEGSTPWHILMPVEVQMLTNVLVAKHTIALKDPLSENDLDYMKLDKNRLMSGYFKNKEEIIGLEASQYIQAGAVFTKKNIRQPILVHRNTAIELIARKNSMTVSVKGIAKTDGRLSDAVQVVNPSSKKVIDAIVIGPNKAEVV